jgi:hypothetical protein
MAKSVLQGTLRTDPPEEIVLFTPEMQGLKQ